MPHTHRFVTGINVRLTCLALLEVTQRLTQLLTLVGLDLTQLSFSPARHDDSPLGLVNQFIDRIFNDALRAGLL